MKRARIVILGLAAAFAGHAAAQTVAPASASVSVSAERRNWYNDPFIELSNAFPGCPVPLGPLITHAQMETDAHYRVEQGTSCWLAHECSKPNSYLYDAPIADAARLRFSGDPVLNGTSLWLTIQRRFIYAEGCADASFDRVAFQRRLEALPDVQHVYLRITGDPRGRPPYKTLAAPD